MVVVVVVLLALSAGLITPQQETIQEEPVEPANNNSLTTRDITHESTESVNSLTITDSRDIWRYQTLELWNIFKIENIAQKSSDNI